MHAALTDRYLHQIKTEDYTIHWDLYLPCFGVRRGKHRLSFVIQRGSDRKTIGHYPSISLAKAREIARTKLLSPMQSTLSLAEIVEEYIARHLVPNTKPRTALESARTLRKHFALETPVQNITLRQISEVIKTMQHTPGMANQSQAHIKAVFNWATGQQYLDKNPLQSLKKPYKLNPRERVLSDTEIRELFAATYNDEYFSLIVRLLLMTAQRRDQIRNLRWAQLSKTHHLGTAGDEGQ